MGSSVQKKPNWTIHGSAQSRGGEYGRVVIRGEATVAGDLSVESLKVMGKLQMTGNLQLKMARIMGQLTMDGSMTGQQMSLFGELVADGDCSLELFRARGAIQVSGLMNAESIDIRLEGQSKVTEIGGGTIKIRPNFHLFTTANGRLQANLIEGDNLYLESTHAEVVRGNSIQIGSACNIGRVEYRHNLTVTGQSNVNEQIKL